MPAVVLSAHSSATTLGLLLFDVLTTRAGICCPCWLYMFTTSSVRPSFRYSVPGDRSIRAGDAAVTVTVADAVLPRADTVISAVPSLMPMIWPLREFTVATGG